MRVGFSADSRSGPVRGRKIASVQVQHPAVQVHADKCVYVAASSVATEISQPDVLRRFITGVTVVPTFQTLKFPIIAVVWMCKPTVGERRDVFSGTT